MKTQQEHAPTTTLTGQSGDAPERVSHKKPSPTQLEALRWVCDHGDRLPIVAMGKMRRRAATTCEHNGWLTWYCKNELLPVPIDSDESIMSVMFFRLTDLGRAALEAGDAR